MPSVFELLFDTYGDHLMQEQVPYDEAEIQAVGHGVAGEKLAQGDVLQHPVSPLLSASSSRSRVSTV